MCKTTVWTILTDVVVFEFSIAGKSGFGSFLSLGHSPGKTDKLYMKAPGGRGVSVFVGEQDLGCSRRHRNMADRSEIVTFSQPYVESGLVMIVPAKQDVRKEWFIIMKALTIKMWIAMAVMTMFTGIAIWLTEHVNGNPEFQGPLHNRIGTMLWFSITLLSFANRESIKSNFSRLVLTSWLFTVFVVSACLTANLAAIMTVPRLQSSDLNVDYLRSTNAPVGCNGNSFIVRYLIDALHFKKENIKKIDSINDYPKAFGRGDIKAGFFVGPHAKIFVAEYCDQFVTLEPRFKLGGFGFVFPKGSSLAIEISEAILKVTQSGEINQLEKEMLPMSNCSLSKDNSDGALDIKPFYGILLASITLSGSVFIVSSVRFLEMHLSIYRLLIEKITFRWASIVLSMSFNRFGLGNQKNMPCTKIDQDLVAVELSVRRS